MPELNELVTTPRGERWEVMEVYQYETSKGIVKVPKGFMTDYASVPRIFRNIVNTYGNHGRAAVVHDFLYSKECVLEITREEADKIFLEIMEECQVNCIKRQFMYRTVRIFGKSHFKKGD